MKTAFITGSSRGIGKSLAIRLSQDGFKVIIHGAVSQKNAEETVSVIRNNGGEADFLLGDLTNVEETAKLCEKIRDVDVLITNASLQYRTAWEDIGLKACYEQINCNFVSSLMLIQAVSEHMKSQKWGRIITIGSVQERKPHPDMLIYSATKAAQTNMSKSLALQLAKYSITVNNVAPGVFNTDRNSEALSDPEYAKKVVDSIPVGFYAEPDDCAGIISLLCSEEGRYITGQNIFVDGGKSVQ